MPACARYEIVDESNVGIYHCVSRCLRRAFLCGDDPFTGHNCDHRKGWIRDRLEELAGAFAIDVLGFAVLSNHLHVILRNRPDVAQKFSDEEVARRWLRLFRKSSPPDQDAAASEEPKLRLLLADSWLSPIADDDAGEAREDSSSSRQASNRGFLPFGLDKYLALLDWTERQVRADKRGAIPADLRPILERLSINVDDWIENICEFGRRFHRFVGRAASMAARASAPITAGFKVRLPAGWHSRDGVTPFEPQHSPPLAQPRSSRARLARASVVGAQPRSLLRFTLAALS